MLIKKHCKSLTTYTNELPPSYVLSSTPIFQGYTSGIYNDRQYNDGEIYILSSDITTPIVAKKHQCIMYFNNQWIIVANSNDIFY